MAGIFDEKYFNAEVFGKYVESVPKVKQNAFINAGIFRTRNDLKALFSEQTGGNFASIPLTGLLSGSAQNYDGATDLTESTIGTYLQSMIVVGRMKGWKEKDFTKDMTGKDFMQVIASQIAGYWDDVDNDTVLATLKGVMGVSANDFSTAHTYDISTSETNPKVSATTLNSAIQQACGANKKIFTLAIMHSVVATNLENLQILNYATQTDENGIQKETALASWNGRTVLVDDDVPFDESTGTYTTYVLGQGAIDYCDCGASEPYEPDRDAKANGGTSMLYTRQRKLFAPRGMSFVQPSTAIVSPTDTQLATASRWTLVKDTAGTGYFDHKAIPIAQIKSLG